MLIIKSYNPCGIRISLPVGTKKKNTRKKTLMESNLSKYF
jgi:hypothetical protein